MKPSSARTQDGRFRLAILMCLWKRPEIADVSLLATLEQLRKSHVSWKMFCVGSEGEPSRELAERHGAEYLECANRPLGRKFDLGLAKTQEWNPDAVMVLGSDNAVTSEFINHSVDKIEGGSEVTGCLDLVAINAHTKDAVHCPGYLEGHKRHGEPIGSGRCYARQLLDRVGWSLWEKADIRKMDGFATQTCRQAKAVWGTFRLKLPELLHIGLKEETSISGWENYEAKGSPLPMEGLIADAFGVGILDRIRSLYGRII